MVYQVHSSSSSLLFYLLFVDQGRYPVWISNKVPGIDPAKIQQLTSLLRDLSLKRKDWHPNSPVRGILFFIICSYYPSSSLKKYDPSFFFFA